MMRQVADYLIESLMRLRAPMRKRGYSKGGMR